MMRVLLIGAGTIGTTHAKVIAEQQHARLVGIVDAEKLALDLDRRQLPTLRSLEDACAELRPDLVVIATPTATHLDLIEQVLHLDDSCLVLVEKPAVATVGELARLSALMRTDSGHRLRFAHHTAYAPEVLWFAGKYGLRDAQGSVTSATCVFHDPYQQDAAGFAQRLGSPWLDSGINALSVLTRFCALGSRLSLRRLDEFGLVEEGRMRIGFGSTASSSTATIVTSWAATTSSKTTRLTYASGLQVHLDHTAVAGYALVDGLVVDQFSSTSSAPRAVQHYRNLYRALLGVADAFLSWKATSRLLDALLSDDDTDAVGVSGASQPSGSSP